MSLNQQTVSPVDTSIYVERALATDVAVDEALARAVQAQRAWAHTSLVERAAHCTAMVEALVDRADADLTHAVENIVDGAMFNSGQSCCGIERVYVHERVFDAFVYGCVRVASHYSLGNPLDPATTLGPMVRAQAADFVRAQVAEAIAQGATALLDSNAFPADRVGTAYLAPQIRIPVEGARSRCSATSA